MSDVKQRKQSQRWEKPSCPPGDSWQEDIFHVCITEDVHLCPLGPDVDTRGCSWTRGDPSLHSGSSRCTIPFYLQHSSLTLPIASIVVAVCCWRVRLTRVLMRAMFALRWNSSALPFPPARSVGVVCPVTAAQPCGCGLLLLCHVLCLCVRKQHFKK